MSSSATQITQPYRVAIQQPFRQVTLVSSFREQVSRMLKSARYINNSVSRVRCSTNQCAVSVSCLSDFFLAYFSGKAKSAKTFQCVPILDRESFVVFHFWLLSKKLRLVFNIKNFRFLKYKKSPNTILVSDFFI